MTPQNPFRCKFEITQKFGNKSSKYSSGYHEGTDFLPLNDQGKPFPAEIYPIFDGSHIFYNDESKIFGKGVKELVELDQELIDYLKKYDVVPENHQGRVQLEILYWHMLKVLDKDGVISKDTPIGLAGNTGYVFSGGVEVPNEQKGVPPYPGLHTHIEALARSGNTIFGKFDVEILLNYKKGITMHLAKDNGTVYLVAGVDQKVKIGIADQESLALFGDEPILNEDTSAIPETQTLTTGFSIHKK